MDRTDRVMGYCKGQPSPLHARTRSPLPRIERVSLFMGGSAVDLRPDVCKHGATRADYLAVIDRNLAVWVRTREAYIRTHADEAVFELTQRIDAALDARSKLTARS